MPNLAELRARVHRATSGMYTDITYMDDLLNDAQYQLFEGAKLRTAVSIPVISGTDTYALPADFKSPGQLMDATDANNVYVYELVDITENKTGYAIESGNIVIKPVPDQDRTLTHYYYKYPARMYDEADTPEIDAQYHDLLTHYAAGMILLLPMLQIQDKTLSDRYLKRWEEGKMTFIADMQRKNKSSRGRTVVEW
jgi:hypothetical protein